MMAGDEDARDWHDSDECYWCLAMQPPVESSCRCGDCCRRLLIEVTVEDAKREPIIKEQCGPIFQSAELTKSGRRELIGFMLNSAKNDYACAFLDQQTNLCTIHETRPLVCRLFDCDAERP
jgi:Fe-S-cluster containining protein